MASLKEIRTRISSVIKTRQVTAAMKMVSAAKLRKAQSNITRFKPYAKKLAEIISSLSDTLLESEDNIFVKERDINKVLLVAITSNKGLCGAFNSNIIRAFMNHAKDNYPEQLSAGNVHALTIGKKGHKILEKFTKVYKNEDEILDKLIFEISAEITDDIIQTFLDGEYDKVEIIYNSFKNAANQYVVIEQFLPIKPSNEDSYSSNSDYIFEPSKEYIIKQIIPQSLKTTLYKSLMDSIAAEHGARMTAMHKATDNAGEILKELKLNYNKARQADITNEILEIVSGAEALD